MVAKLRAVPNKRSPEREALAQAIADAAAAHRVALKAHAAKERAQDMVAAAEAKLVQATAGIDKARDAQATTMAKVATSGGRMRADSTTRNARLKEADAQDELEAAKAALAQCEVPLAEHEYDLQSQLSTAADAVIRSESASRVLKEAKVLQEKLITARVALRFLYAKNLLPEALMVEAKSVLWFREFATWPGNVEYHRWEEHEEHKRWAALYAELTKDADAEVG
jgi:hypothetical protein